MPQTSSETSRKALELVPGIDFVPAPVPTRLIAYVLDVATTVVLLVALDRFVAPWFSSALGEGSFVGRTMNLTLVFIVVLGYWVVVPAVSGATAGKRLFGLRVVPMRDRPLGLDQVILREVVGHVLNATTVGIGFLTGLSDARQRGWNDRLAGTRIVLLTPPLPQLYHLQDLRTVDLEGRLGSDLIGLPGPTVTSSAPSAQPQDAEPGRSEAPAAGAGPAAAQDSSGPQPPPPAAQEVAPPRAAPRPRPKLPGPAPPPKGATLYARPQGETAYERKLRAAMGPTVPELAEALRRTAKLVAEGTLMPKVLDRKRADFVASMESVHLGEHPREAVRIVVELGRDGMLTREDLQRVRDLLAQRLKAEPRQGEQNG